LGYRIVAESSKLKAERGKPDALEDFVGFVDLGESNPFT
jgi:hypothetical protein